MRNLSILLALFCVVVLGNANVITPSFDGAPNGGWVTDRYQPNVFADIGSFQGRNDVLQIGISDLQGMGNRGGQNSQFYNTQGMQYLVSGGAGSILSADLWIPEEWSDDDNGSRRTDMWGIMTNGSSVSAYPIIGFSNYAGVSTLRAWDADTIGWINFQNPVQYGAWNSLAIAFTGTSFDYYVNGSLAYSDTTANGSTGFQGLIMQAYNYNGDASLTDAVIVDGKGNYSAHWSNTVAGEPVPEPGTILLSGLGLLVLGFWRRRQQKQ